MTSLPPVYGLYSSIVPMIVYFFFGTSAFQNIGILFLFINLELTEKIRSFRCNIYHGSKICIRIGHLAERYGVQYIQRLINNDQLQFFPGN